VSLPFPAGFIDSSDVCVLLLGANAMWRPTFGTAQGADVNIQLSKSTNESAPVHSQHPSSLALIPFDISKNGKNEVLSKFCQPFKIEDACPMHPPHQCLKLPFRGVRMFSTHGRPGAFCIGFVAKSAGAPRTP
jgi:hypothetical protein